MAILHYLIDLLNCFEMVIMVEILKGSILVYRKQWKLGKIMLMDQHTGIKMVKVQNSQISHYLKE